MIKIALQWGPIAIGLTPLRSKNSKKLLEKRSRHSGFALGYPLAYGSALTSFGGYDLFSGIS